MFYDVMQGTRYLVLICFESSINSMESHLLPKVH